MPLAVLRVGVFVVEKVQQVVKERFFDLVHRGDDPVRSIGLISTCFYSYENLLSAKREPTTTLLSKIYFDPHKDLFVSNYGDNPHKYD